MQITLIHFAKVHDEKRLRQLNMIQVLNFCCKQMPYGLINGKFIPIRASICFQFIAEPSLW